MVAVPLLSRLPLASGKGETDVVRLCGWLRGGHGTAELRLKLLHLGPSPVFPPLVLQGALRRTGQFIRTCAVNARLMCPHPRPVGHVSPWSLSWVCVPCRLQALIFHVFWEP